MLMIDYWPFHRKFLIQSTRFQMSDLLWCPLRWPLFLTRSLIMNSHSKNRWKIFKVLKIVTGAWAKCVLSSQGLILQWMLPQTREASFAHTTHSLTHSLGKEASARKRDEKHRHGERELGLLLGYLLISLSLSPSHIVYADRKNNFLYYCKWRTWEFVCQIHDCFQAWFP